jgi:HTH-type transcriptional regulator / antitoxin HipB
MNLPEREDCGRFDAAEPNIFPNGKMEDVRIESQEDLGALIRRRRTDLRLTQEELAAVALVTPRLLGEVERGKKTTQLDGVLRILAALGLDLYARAR